jgi:hypothetical protein
MYGWMQEAARCAVEAMNEQKLFEERISWHYHSLCLAQQYVAAAYYWLRTLDVPSCNEIRQVLLWSRQTGRECLMFLLQEKIVGVFSIKMCRRMLSLIDETLFWLRYVERRLQGEAFISHQLECFTHLDIAFRLFALDYGRLAYLFCLLYQESFRVLPRTA